MAKVKITQLPGYIEIDKQNDLLPIVDKLNTETKKITSDNLVLSYAATPEDIDRGISDEVYITPKALFDSTAYVSMSFMTVAYNGNKPLTTIDEAYQDVPNEMEGYTLVSWSAMCVDPSSSGDIVFSITHDGIDMFTSSITIDEWHTSSRTSTHPAVVNPFNQTLSAGKVIHFAVTSKGTGVTFAKVTLGFRNKAISGGGAGGGGDVYGPSSVVDDDIAVFDGTSGKVIKDSGVKITDIALGDVQGPVHSYDRDVPIFDGTTGKVIADSGITIDELKDHNQLDNLQGGDSTSNEYYHLTSEEHDRVNPATETTLGVVKIGDGLTVEEDGTINAVDPILDHNLLENLQGGDSTSNEYYHLTQTEHTNATSIATEVTLGLSMIGTGLTITEEGVLSASLGFGLGLGDGNEIEVKLGDGLEFDGFNQVSLKVATDSILGGVKVGDGLTITPEGVLTVDEPATDHNYLNGLQGGDATSSEYFHLTESEHNKVIERTEIATENSLGVIQVGDGLVIDSTTGILSIDLLYLGEWGT